MGGALAKFLAKWAASGKLSAGEMAALERLGKEISGRYGEARIVFDLQKMLPAQERDIAWLYKPSLVGAAGRVEDAKKALSDAAEPFRKTSGGDWGGFRFGEADKASQELREIMWNALVEAKTYSKG